MGHTLNSTGTYALTLLALKIGMKVQYEINIAKWKIAGRGKEWLKSNKIVQL